MKIQLNSQRMAMAINSGSSSLKIGFFDISATECKELLCGSVERIGRSDGRLRLIDPEGHILLEENQRFESQEMALLCLVEASRSHIDEPPSIIGHRIVHGGPELLHHQVITCSVLRKLKAAEHFAPLHLPQSIQLIQASQQMFTGIPQIACFDTEFHQTMPALAKRFPLPVQFEQRGVRRYGFHGLSYESVVHQLGDRLLERAVFAHLGSGSSLCAVRSGSSIDTTMGMTPTGGVLMGTRSGDLDPGVVLFLLQSEHVSAADLDELLNHRSGLSALSDGETDMKKLLEMRHSGNPLAEFAISAYTTAIRKAIGAYAALLSGMDLLVFTGGIGEHSAEIRNQICSGLDFLGLGIGSTKVVVIPSQEEQQIARICRSKLNSDKPLNICTSCHCKSPTLETGHPQLIELTLRSLNTRP
jgi:acetate kinase